MWGEWFGRPNTGERSVLDFRNPALDYRVVGFKCAHPNVPPGARCAEW